jgi:ubiquinone biosynthesis protein
MQDRSLIPTPLPVRDKRPIRLAPPIPPGPWRVVRIVGLVFRLTYLWWRSELGTRFWRRPSSKEPMRRIRVFLERLGGMWVKAGQVVAMRRDIFAAETCDELARLQDQAQGFAWPVARGILEEELGRPVEEIFSEIDEHPVAAASIGQTHVARLRRNGVRVAVKVQRPFVAESFRRDLRYVWFVIFCLRVLGVAPEARWAEMAWELESALTEELDYRMEASAIQRMRRRLAKHGIYAPKVFLRESTRRVLVMEFVEGAFMSDYVKASAEDPDALQRWLAENDIDPPKVGERLILSHLRQIFEDELYHGDLHPGNILLQRHSRLALIDFGTVGSFDASLLERYRRMFSALAGRDYGRVVDMFLLMCPPLPDTDVDELKTELVRALRVWSARTTIKRLPYHEKSLSALSASFAVLLGKYRIPSNWEFLRLNRSDFTMDSSLMFLIPEIDYPRICRKYERKARARALRRAGRGKTLRRAVGELLEASKVPAMLAEKLYFDVEWTRGRAMAFEGKISKLAYLGRSALTLFAWGTTALGLLFLGKYLHHHTGWRDSLLHAPFLDRAFEALPALRPEVWLLLVLAALYVARRLMRAQKYVGAKDYERRGR